MALDLFSPVLHQRKQHPIFRRLCEPKYGPERDVLVDWSRGFVDRDGKFVNEFQSTFESSMWELYVHACIREMGGVLDFGYARPDFVTTLREVSLCVEATVAQPPEPGTPACGVGPPDIPDDLNEFNRDATVRICTRFAAKSDHYIQEYSKLDHAAEQPFVIAIAPFDRPLSHLAHNRPILAALYGLYFDEERTIATGSRRVIRYPVSSVWKSRSTELPIGFFGGKRHEHISAVIYSPVAGMGKIRALAEHPTDQIMFTTIHPSSQSIAPIVRQTPKSDYREHLLDGLYIFHNPHARYPLGLDTFAHERVAQVWVAEDGQLVDTAPDDFLQFRMALTIRTP